MRLTCHLSYHYHRKYEEKIKNNRAASLLIKASGGAVRGAVRGAVCHDANQRARQ
jgi:hypothetical protein